VKEHKENTGLAQCQVHIPHLKFVPPQRVVDVQVQTNRLATEKVPERQVSEAVNVVEIADNTRLVAVLFGEPREAAYHRRGRFTSKC